MSFKRPLNEAMAAMAMAVAICNRYDRAQLEDIIRRGQHHAGGDGYPTSSMSDGSGSTTTSDDTSTERSAMADPQRDNVGDALREGMSGFLEALKILTIADQRLQFALNAGSKIEGRVNTVELCAGCGMPAPKVKRLDGQPYHHPEVDTCWWTAYNASRGRRPAANE